MITHDKLRTVLIVAAICFFLFWLPITRPIMIFLLPLGRGIDDLIVILALVFIILYYGSRWYIEFQKMQNFRKIDRNRNTKYKHVAITILGILSLMITSGSELNKIVMFGKPLDPTTAIIVAAHILVVAVLWNAVSYFDRRRR